MALDRQDKRQRATIGLTPAEEQIAQYFAQGMSLADAYRKLHPEKQNLSDMAAGAGGAIFWRKELLQARVKDIQSKAAEKVVNKISYTLETAMEECGDALNMAKANMKASEMVTAIRLKAELNGLLVKMAKNPKDKTPLDDFTTDELKDVLREIHKQKTGGKLLTVVK